MSERRRCVEIVYLGLIDEKRGRVARPLRAICDRPIGHGGPKHKGRLAVGQETYGIVEWTIKP